MRYAEIFVDESGDFGFSLGSSRLYVVTFVCSDDRSELVKELAYLNKRLFDFNYKGMIHTSLLVAKRGEYSGMDLQSRKYIFYMFLILVEELM